MPPAASCSSPPAPTTTLRAFDARTGAELWATALEASGYATPMTYLGASGKQYIRVIAAGGGGHLGGAGSDTLAAYALGDRGRGFCGDHPMVVPGCGQHLGGVGSSPEAVTPPASGELPPGYRQGLVTAITVILGFSLAFVRFWGLESPGRWTTGDIVSAAAVAVGTGFQLFALFQSLRVEDNAPPQYARTVRYFLVGVLVVMLGLFAAILFDAGPEHPTLRQSAARFRPTTDPSSRGRTG